MRKTLKVILPIFAFILAVSGAFIFLCVKAGNSDYILPGVTAAGVDVGGLTVDEAAERLRAAGYEARANLVFVTVSFPDGTSAETNGGLVFSAKEEAKKAAAIGKGSFFRNGAEWISAFLGKEKRELQMPFSPKKENISEALSTHIEALNAVLSKDPYEITNSALYINKGASETAADLKEAERITLEALERSFNTLTPVAVTYELPELPEDPGLSEMRQIVYRASKPAAYSEEIKGIIEGSGGKDIDLEKALEEYEKAAFGDTIIVPLLDTEPEIYSAELWDDLFGELLTESRTYVNGTSNRVTNVTLAAEAINGLILNPGEIFSYNEVVGERTREKGYKLAGALAGGVHTSAIGGGVCQVSSTIYDSLLKTQVKVLERRAHSASVPYLPRGHDATVNWGTQDFKFQNNTEYPMLLELSVSEDRYLTVHIYGTAVYAQENILPE